MKTFVVLLLFIFSAQASAQTLADIARRERERQKQAQTKNHGTFTNANTTGSGAAAPAPQPAAANPAASTEKPAEKKEEIPAKPTGPTDNKGRDEKYWRDAFQKARDAVKKADERVQLQENRIKDLNTQLLRQDDIYNKEMVVGAQINTAQKDLDTAKAEAEKARNNVTRLEDELRAAGGLPGWAR
jgi:hypothetical protein